MGFKMKSKATSEAAKKATERGGGLRQFKMDENKLSARLLILGPVKEDAAAVFVAKTHEIWANGKPVHICGTPSVDIKGKETGEKDSIQDLGWKLRDKYSNSTNEKKKDFWKRFLLKTKNVMNVLDLDNIEAGPLTYIMPMAVSDVVLEEFIEVGEDISSICDFNEGRILYIKHNGKKKLARKYKIVKFKNETANLIDDGILDDEALQSLEEKLYDLTKFQPKYSDAEFEKHLEHLGKSAQSLGIDLDDIEVEEEELEEYDEDEVEDGEEIDDEELELDEDEEEADEDEEEAEEIEEDEEEEYADDEEELPEFDDELEEDEEEEPRPAKKKAAKKKVAKKKVAKKKVAKKKVRRKKS